MSKYADLKENLIKCENCGGEEFVEREIHIDSPTQSINPDDLIPEMRDDITHELMCAECNLSRTYTKEVRPFTGD